MLYIKRRFREIMSVKEAPHVIAISFAVGVFFGISPLVGLHTLLGLAAAWIFGLNRLVVLSGVYINNPWSMIPIYTFCTWIGALLLGTDDVFPDLEGATLTMGSLPDKFSHLLLPFAVGATAVALAASIVCYFLLRHAVEKYQEGTG